MKTADIQNSLSSRMREFFFLPSFSFAPLLVWFNLVSFVCVCVCVSIYIYIELSIWFEIHCSREKLLEQNTSLCAIYWHISECRMIKIFGEHLSLMNYPSINCIHCSLNEAKNSSEFNYPAPHALCLMTLYSKKQIQHISFYVHT